MARVDLRNASRRLRTGHSNRGVAMEYPWRIPLSPVWDTCGLSLVDKLPNSRFPGSARDRRPGRVNPGWHSSQATASPSISLSFLRNTGHRNRIESRLREQPLPGTRGSALYLIRDRRVGIANRALYSSQGVVDECPQAYAYIRDHERVLSENVGALVLTGRPVLLSNPFVYAQLVRSGKWPSDRVEQMLEESTADLVIIGKPRISEQRWSQPALAALASHYHVSKRFACADAMVAYEPNSPRAAPLP